MLPKYIKQKIDRLNNILEDAYTLKSEIERWAESKNVDTSSNEYYENVIDDCSVVNGIIKEGLEELLGKEAGNKSPEDQKKWIKRGKGNFYV